MLNFQSCCRDESALFDTVVCHTYSTRTIRTAPLGGTTLCEATYVGLQVHILTSQLYYTVQYIAYGIMYIGALVEMVVFSASPLTLQLKYRVSLAGTTSAPSELLFAL